MTIVRSILAVFVGLILLSISADLVEQVGRSVYPIPSAVEQARIRYAETLESHESGIAGAGEVAEARGGLRDAVVEYLGSAPAGALVFVVMSWIIGGFVGAAVAAFLTPVWRIPTVVVIGVLETRGRQQNDCERQRSCATRLHIVLGIRFTREAVLLNRKGDMPGLCPLHSIVMF